MSIDEKSSGESDERYRAEICLDAAPSTRAALDANPQMWPRITSDVPPGWDIEVASSISLLSQLAADTGVEILIAQFKSKFGKLRVYLDIEEDQVAPFESTVASSMSARYQNTASTASVSERARSIVDATAGRCSTRCEVCGATAVLVNKAGWLVTACPTHAGTNRLT
jgi:hypothetical protein